MTDDQVLPFLPEEIIVIILQKLQAADALLRFRCVSKQWRRLISETKISKQKLLVKCLPRVGESSFWSIDRTTCNVEEVDVPWEREETWFYGSCNGLILVGFLDDLFLWNPFTRYSEKFLSHEGLENFRCYVAAGGLCFDSINNEYKVVMSHNHRVVPIGSAMVGSSRNKTWKLIDFPYQDGRSLKSGPLFNNHIHWAVSKPDSAFEYPTVIIYFDAEIDEFVELPMPSAHEGEWNAIVGLGVLDGCLCMSRAKKEWMCEVQIMVMKVHGAGESWTTLFKIEGHVFTDAFVPFFYCDEKKSEVMMKIVSPRSDSIITYDPNAKSRRDISSSSYIDCATVYEETLIRPTRF